MSVAVPWPCGAFSRENLPAAIEAMSKVGSIVTRMKLTSFCRKDQMHLLDFLDVGLIDADWPKRFPPELAARLQELIDHPEG